MNRKLTIFCCAAFLFIVAFSLRFYKVASVPSGTMIDEASFGYNAYSILQTGKDEHGIHMPLVFKAFGDEKLPVYVYSITPFIELFGLNNISVRFPSVIAGSLIGIFLFLFLIEFGYKIKLSFLGSLIAITSPWSITLSRFGYESNVALMFFIAGLYFSFLASRKKSVVLSIFGGLFMGVTWYTYIAYRFVTPFLLITIIILYYVKQKRITSIGLTLIISFVIMISPFIFNVFSSQGTARLRQTGLITNMGITMNINESRTFCSTHAPKLICYLVANKPLSYTYTYLSRYITTLSINYLFVSGDKNVTYLNVDDYGLLYIFLIPLYLLGLFSIYNRFMKRKNTKLDFLILAGIIIAPLPSVLSGDPQKVRLTPLFPFILLVIVYGIHFLDEHIKLTSIKTLLFLSTVMGAIGFTFFFMINLITVHIDKYEITYGAYVPKLMFYLNKQEKDTKIYIKSITEGIIFYAFFNKINPNYYQKMVVHSPSDEIGFAQPIKLGNIQITENNMHQTYCKSMKDHDKALYVTNEDLRNTLGEAKKIIWTENGVHKMAFIYDINAIDKTKFNCTNFEQ